MTNSLQNPAGRDRAIDVAKGLGMLLVMFAHTNYGEPLLTIIYSFHMPLFFILSGMLFSDRRYPTFRSFFIRRLKTLMVPFFIYAGITLLFSCLAVWQRDGLNSAYPITMLKMLVKTFAARGARDFDFNAPIWFVPCLFLTECLYYFVNKIKKTPLFIAAVTAVFAGGWALCYTLVGGRYYIWDFPTAMFAISFFAIGHRVLGPARKALLDRNFKKWQFAMVAVAALAATVPLALWNGKISLSSNNVGQFGGLLLLTGVLGTVFILAVSQLFTAKGIEYIGRYSFDFMAIHVMVRIALNEALKRFLSFDYWLVKTDYRVSLPVFVAVVAITTVIVVLKNLVFRKKKA